MTAPPVLGADADGLEAGKVVTLDDRALTFPAPLSRLRAGRYHVQAVFDHGIDVRLPQAPGNLVSRPVAVDLDPRTGGTVRLELVRALPEVEEKAAPHIRYLRFRSERLTKFWGRPVYLRAAVRLPHGWETDRERRYPLRVHIGGFGQRYTDLGRMERPAADGPRFLTLMLDGAGPLGDPYQVNSANHGPYGDAITRELIPHVEKEFRGIGEAYARVLDGASTGGWVSLALQVFYPDFFNGCWSHCPDPVDFRSFQLLNLYEDRNAYVNDKGFERPSMRTLDGDTEHPMRHEVLLERVIGRGGRWWLSGRDWASWNATFGPRGKDGLPMPLWDGETGRIDRRVLDHWRKYDLRHHLEANWKELAPKLHGKLRVYVGDADEYFLNNAVERLKVFLDAARPPFGGKVVFRRREGHNWRALTEKELLAEMDRVVRAGRPK
jgi:hypothetical protein